LKFPPKERHSEVTTQNTTATAAAEPLLARPSGRRRRNLVRFVPVAFAVVLVVAVFSGLWSAANGPDGPAPRSLAGMSLAQLIAGPEAVSQMSKLHGKGVGVVDGYIAHYQGSGGGAVLYVGRMGSVENAVALNQQMVDRIAVGNPMFTDLSSLTVEGTEVFKVRSGPESHYFWREGELINWIGFDRDSPAALAEAVRVVR
jgi:hypothetical protein